MSAPAAPRRARFAFRAETVDSIFGIAYTVLMVDASLVLANAPLAVALLLVPDPLAAWPFFLLLSLTVAPSIAGAFEAFRRLRSDDRPAPFAAFWGAWRSTLPRSLGVGLVAGAAVFVVLFDLTVLAGTAWAPLLGPLLLVVAALAVSVALASLAGFALFEVRAWAVVKAALYLTVRRWYFTAVNLILVASLVAVMLVQPVLGAVIAPALLLYPVWANLHFGFAALLRSDG